MAPEKKQLSNLIPVLVAAIVCDVAVTDPSTGKKNLIGVFDHIDVAKFPTQRPLSVYAKLTDAEGYYELEMKFVQVATGKVLAGVEGQLDAKDRLGSGDMFISFPPLPIPEAGRYEFQLWANGVFLGATFIDARQR